MVEKIKNSRKTENPYELISGIRLSIADNRSINVSIHGTSFEAIKVKKSLRLTMKKFKVIEPMIPKKKSELGAYMVLNKVSNFAKKCKNPLEVITMFIDAYNENKKYLNIDISTVPVYSDNTDKQFVINQLL